MAFDGEVILHGAREVVLIKRSRIASGLAPDTLASKMISNHANALEKLDADAFDIHYLPTDARVDEQEVDHQVMAPGAANHRAAKTGGNQSAVTLR